MQASLIALQQGTDEKYLEQKAALEEERDYELTRLRLWEEYQVKRVEEEYQGDIVKAQENHEKMIKLIKEKLYDKLQRQIKQLKEDKFLLNLVNARSWAQNGQSDPSIAALNAAAVSLNFNDRRSLRKREMGSRFTTGEVNDLSDGGTTNMETGGYSSTGKRRRHYATRYSSNDEMTSEITSANGHKSKNGSNSEINSGTDSNLSDKDYDALNKLIMDNKDGGSSLVIEKTQGSSHRTSRSSNKQFTDLQGLKPEELNDDLTLLRNAVMKK